MKQTRGNNIAGNQGKSACHQMLYARGHLLVRLCRYSGHQGREALSVRQGGAHCFLRSRHFEDTFEKSKKAIFGRSPGCAR
jgi:hypothetical protein